MSMISQIQGSLYAATYEPKLLNTKESENKKDEKLKDSVAFSNKDSVSLSDDSGIAVLKKLVESQADIRERKVSALKEQIGRGTYSIDDKIDKISESVIDTMLA